MDRTIVGVNYNYQRVIITDTNITTISRNSCGHESVHILEIVVDSEEGYHRPGFMIYDNCIHLHSLAIQCELIITMRDRREIILEDCTIEHILAHCFYLHVTGNATIYMLRGQIDHLIIDRSVVVSDSDIVSDDIYNYSRDSFLCGTTLWFYIYFMKSFELFQYENNRIQSHIHVFEDQDNIEHMEKKWLKTRWIIPCGRWFIRKYQYPQTIRIFNIGSMSGRDMVIMPMPQHRVVMWY